MTPLLPPFGALRDSLHWLHRPTAGTRQWMLATWTGYGWDILSGRIERPNSEALVWWQYWAPATPPPRYEACAALASPFNKRETGPENSREEVAPMGKNTTRDWCIGPLGAATKEDIDVQ